MMKKLLVSTVAATFVMAASASAATFTLLGGAVDSIPGGSTGVEATTPTNDVLDGIGLGPSMDGYGGANVQLNFNVSSVRVDYYGYEAFNDNSFVLGGTEIFEKGFYGGPGEDIATGVSTPLATYFSGPLTAGLLDFQFESINSVGDTAVSSNLLPNPTSGANFFASFGPGPSSVVRDGNSLWLFFDDKVQAGDNHDDFVVRISAVPLPAGSLLLLSGLAALGLRRRRKS